ncbi:diaminopimelate decarboxylase [Kineococcus sp. SYSU DK005]|uniref:diaminopimelate decarboxylase n=1 Tax=Kineococcus sp. SYSU DK005 TaxID=3383126 RepID=UPI003D7E7BCB
MTAVAERAAALAAPWPASAALTADGDVRVAGVSLTEVARRFGTPCHVLDEGEVRARARAYRRAFGGPDARGRVAVHYAAKAFACRGLLSWLKDEGLGVDACSAGELRCALDAGVPAHRVLLHGNAKSGEDLRAAVEAGVGRVVLDSADEAHRLAALLPAGARQRVLLRVVPHVEAGAHPEVRTGTADAQFGVDGPELTAAVAAVREHPALELTGLHCHLGSQVTEVEPYALAARRLVALAARVRNSTGVVVREVDLGGGHGVASRTGGAALDVARLARVLRGELEAACAAAGLPVPRLLVEPGRALVAPAGAVLYRVVGVKTTGRRTFVAVDGGMSDNPRPALYGALGEPRLLGRPAGAPVREVALVGRHCETGDVLAPAVDLPADVRAGDLVAVPAAGAYQASMASNYNAVPRPPVVALRAGTARLLVRRETVEDLRRRDVGV